MLSHLQGHARACGAILGLALLVGSGGLALREWIVQQDRRASDARAAFLMERLPRTGVPDGEEIAATYDGVFHATVYYTPLESAFAQKDGFDMTPATRPGLLGKEFSSDFLKAVEMEGFGRMKTPMNGKWYVSSCRGRWGYAATPLDACGRPLRALRSTAIAAEFELVRSQTHFRIRAPGAPHEFLAARWQVCDTGRGLKEGQIDFYWGEDAPLGPGLRLSRPRGMPNPVTKPTILVLR